MTIRPLAGETTQHHRVGSMSALKNQQSYAARFPRLESCSKQLPAMWPSYYLR